MERITYLSNLPDGTEAVFHNGHVYCRAHFSTDEEYEEYKSILNRLAAFEDVMDRWATRDINEIDRYFRRINAVGGLDRIVDYYRKEAAL